MEEGRLDVAAGADEAGGEVHVQLPAEQSGAAAVGLEDGAARVAAEPLPEQVAGGAEVLDLVDLDLPEDAAAGRVALAGGRCGGGGGEAQEGDGEEGDEGAELHFERFVGGSEWVALVEKSVWLRESGWWFGWETLVDLGRLGVVKVPVSVLEESLVLGGRWLVFYVLLPAVQGIVETGFFPVEAFFLPSKTAWLSQQASR